MNKKYIGDKDYSPTQLNFWIHAIKCGIGSTKGVLILRLRQHLKTITSDDRMTDELLKWKYLGQATVISSRYRSLPRIMTLISVAFSRWGGVGGWGESSRSIFMPNDRSIPLKKSTGQKCSRAFEGKVILLWGTEPSVEFCLIRDTRKFCTLLIIFWTPNKWRPVEGGRYLRHWQGLYVFSASFARREATTAHGVKATAFLLSTQ